jgi:hypothetical protein
MQEAYRKQPTLRPHGFRAWAVAPQHHQGHPRLSSELERGGRRLSGLLEIVSGCESNPAPPKRLKIRFVRIGSRILSYLLKPQFPYE